LQFFFKPFECMHEWMTSIDYYEHIKSIENRIN